MILSKRANTIPDKNPIVWGQSNPHVEAEGTELSEYGNFLQIPLLDSEKFLSYVLYNVILDYIVKLSRIVDT